MTLTFPPTASLDTERASQAVETFSDPIHEQKRAGIMVTHDLRMCQYANRVIQVQDGVARRILEDRQEIDALARAGKQDYAPTLVPTVELRPNGLLRNPLPGMTQGTLAEANTCLTSQAHCEQRRMPHVSRKERQELFRKSLADFGLA